MQSLAYAVHHKDDTFKPHEFTRREVGEEDVLVSIKYCGICHSDIHTARCEWGQAHFPCIPGHEIVGTVDRVGAKVTKFKQGDRVGVGCFVDSCRECKYCKAGEEQFCEKGFSGTYNSKEQERNGRAPTYGGYSNQIVVPESYVLRLSEKFKSLDAVAPLLCAGITMYSPLNAHKDKVVGKKVGIVGLGGLGHMGIKIAAAMGAEVTVFSTSPSKKEDAMKLGAKHFVCTKNEEELKAVKGTLSLIVNTISAKHEPSVYLAALEIHGTLVCVGVAPEALSLHMFDIVMHNKKIEGSLIGGIKETQEMLDFCAEKGIVSDIEVISFDKINEAYDRTVKSDVKYRFVLDHATLKK